MMDMILHYDFMQRALIAGLIIGVIAPMVGLFLVVRRLSLIADAPPMSPCPEWRRVSCCKSMFPFSITESLIYGDGILGGGGLVCGTLSPSVSLVPELAIPVILSGGVGLGVVLISAADGFNVDVAGYLFGSILTVGPSDLTAIITAGILATAMVILFTRSCLSSPSMKRLRSFPGCPAAGSTSSSAR